MDIKIQSWLDSLSHPFKPHEYEVYQLLQSYDLTVPPHQLISPSENNVTVNFEGPYVLKVCSANILHKTEKGGVKIGVSQKNLNENIQELQKTFPGELILVSQLITFIGTEFIIGGVTDPVFGKSIMVGAGGVLTELYKDTSFRLIPLEKSDISEMLDELTISPLLNGYRNINLDKEALISIIAKIATIIEDFGDLFKSLDMNPIVFTNDGWVSLDAKFEFNIPKFSEH